MMVNKIQSEPPVMPNKFEGMKWEELQRKVETVKTEQQQEKKKEINDRKVMEGVVDAINDFLNPVYTSLKFELYDKLNEYYVQVVNVNTQEVIREIPPKKLLDVYAAMAEYIGLIVDEKI